MNRSIVTLILCGIFLCQFISAQDNNKAVKAAVIPLSEMVEFHQRGGLPNLFQKIKSQRQVRIAYIGGSITESPNGWRDLSFSWFRLTFPQTAFYQIDASIGGTGSGLGVFRLDRDVLDGNPDLIFVEFAVNGTGVPPHNAREPMVRTMEGIVRKTWTRFPNADICFVYTTALNVINDLVKGIPTKSPEFMEEVAEYYGIPTIHMGIEVARLMSQGKLVFKADPSENANTIVFTRDGTHPLQESGHPIYGATVAKYLSQMKEKVFQVNHLLPQPIMEDNWQNARMLDISETKLEGNWTKLPETHDLLVRFKKFMPTVYQAKPGSTMSFRFKGTFLGIYDCVGPGTGIIEITIDGKKEEMFRFDQWCDNYRRHNFFLNELENKVHEVEIKVMNKPIDKAAILRLKNITITDPVKYAEIDWYPANIMIVGELLKL